MKARIRKTGEIVDVFSFNSHDKYRSTHDYVSYTDSAGTKHCGYYLNFYFDFKPIDDPINWEQRRFELAKSAMQGIVSNEDEVEYAYLEASYGEGKHMIPKAIAQFAIACADALIEELKKK